MVSRAATLGTLYLLRNPLGVAPSYANHNGSSIDDAITRMSKQGHPLNPSRKSLASQVRQQLLTWSGHVLSWVDAPGLNRQVIHYEDMLSHPVSTFTAAARFLHLPEDAARIEKALRFSDFRELARQEAAKGFREKHPRTERFFRQGKSGGWRDQLTPEQVGRIIADHGAVMRRFGYLDVDDRPTDG